MFYYSRNDEFADHAYYCKKLEANEIIRLNTIFDSISTDSLELKTCRDCLYHGPHYTFIDHNKTSSFTHFHQPTIAVENLLKFGRQLVSENKMVKTDSVYMRKVHVQVLKDNRERAPKCINCPLLKVIVDK